MRWFGLTLVAVAMVAGVIHVLPGLVGQSTASPESRTAEQLAARTKMSRIFAGGAVEGTQRDVHLQFEVPGRISRILVEEGDQVEAGDVLAELDPRTWDLKLAEALARLKLARAERDRLINGASQETRAVLKSEVKAAEVQVRENEALLARGRQLSQRSALSKHELDDYAFKYERASAQLQTVRARLEELEAPARKDELSIAEAKVALAEAMVRQEQTQIAKTRLRAPCQGIVLHVQAEPGQLAGPEDGRDLFTVVNRDATRVRAYVEELDALEVKIGQSVVVTADGKPNEEYHGIVRSCAPHVRPKSHRHLKPGEMVDLRVREIVIELMKGDDLVIGLPVDVFIERDLPLASSSGVPVNKSAPLAVSTPVKQRAQRSVRVDGEASPSRRSVKSQAETDVSAKQ